MDNAQLKLIPVYTCWRMYMCGYLTKGVYAHASHSFNYCHTSLLILHLFMSLWNVHKRLISIFSLLLESISTLDAYSRSTRRILISAHPPGSEQAKTVAQPEQRQLIQTLLGFWKKTPLRTISDTHCYFWKTLASLPSFLLGAFLMLSYIQWRWG